MINLLEDIDSLSNFKRNSAGFVEKLKKSGRPIILTVNGKAEIVLQDAKTYQKILDSLEQINAIKSLNASLQDIKEGRTKKAEDFFQEFFNKHDIQR